MVGVASEPPPAKEALDRWLVEEEEEEEDFSG